MKVVNGLCKGWKIFSLEIEKYYGAVVRLNVGLYRMIIAAQRDDSRVNVIA
jgi:hypothetical protein